MKREIKCTFQITSWNEETIGKIIESSKISRATVTQTYSGGMEGEGTVSYAMYYRDEKTATFVGFERFEGSVNNKSGSFVVRHDGVFKDGRASSDWIVAIESGTEELIGISGEGTFNASHAGKARVTCRLVLPG